MLKGLGRLSNEKRILYDFDGYLVLKLWVEQETKKDNDVGQLEKFNDKIER